MNRESVRYWLRILAGTLVAAAFVVFAFSGATLRSPPAALARAFGIALLYSAIIGPMVGLVMPRVAPWIWANTRFPINWIATIATMTVVALAGSIVAIAVLRVIGVVRPGEFAEWLQGSLRIAIVVTLTIGLFITAYQVMQARLAHATARAQLASLEARVQPHFLFNTLNSIASLIHEDPKGAERMTTQLASLLRSSLDQQATPLVSLDDELRVVRDYLAIEQVRFGPRLRYEIDVGDGLAAARLPRLALQTLVENSVKYAVSARREGGSILVRAMPSNDGWRVDVEDNGPGFDVGNLPDGHGLALLRDRLRLLFRDGASLRLSSTPERTIASLFLPHTHDRPSSRPSPRDTDCPPLDKLPVR